MAFWKVISAALLIGLATLQPCRGQSRIIGGTPVTNARYPYFAELRIVYNENGEQLVTNCGGALITPDRVLTAGHCIDNPDIVSVFVTFGRLSNPEDTSFISVKAASLIPHPDRNKKLKTNDIGIVLLSQKVSITPIKLSFASGYPAQGANVTVIGFGQTTPSGRQAKNLNQVQLRVRNWNDCYKLYGEDDGPTKICAGGNGKTGALGDSGAPMLVKGRSRSQDISVGIVSHGPTPWNGMPIVYTRVSAYKSWIRKNACIGSNLPSWCTG